MKIFNIISSYSSIHGDISSEQSYSLWSGAKMKHEKPRRSSCALRNHQGLCAADVKQATQKTQVCWANTLPTQRLYEQSPIPQRGFGNGRFNLRKGQLKMGHFGLYQSKLVWGSVGWRVLGGICLLVMGNRRRRKKNVEGFYFAFTLN